MSLYHFPNLEASFSTSVCHLADCQQLICPIPHKGLLTEENAAYILISVPPLAQNVEVYLFSLKVQSRWLGRWNSVGFYLWEALLVLVLGFFFSFFFLKIIIQGYFVSKWLQNWVVGSGIWPLALLENDIEEMNHDLSWRKLLLARPLPHTSQELECRQ